MVMILIVMTTQTTAVCFFFEKPVLSYFGGMCGVFVMLKCPPHQSILFQKCSELSKCMCANFFSALFFVQEDFCAGCKNRDDCRAVYCLLFSV